MIRAAPLDFAAAWNALVRDSDLQDAAFDLAFWEEYADEYDADPVTHQETLNVLASLLRPEDALLDVGAGTGRFALPLASHVTSVTALDHSPAMLTVLRRKLRAQDIHNVRVLQADLQTADLLEHDVVLAAWALYRQADILAALQKLVEAARRVLVIVDGDLHVPPHQRALREIWGADDHPDIPNYLILLGALWQIGIRADVRVVYETCQYHGASPRDIAQQLAPDNADEGQLNRYTAAIASLMERVADGWRYAYRFPVGILIWERR